MAPAKNKSRLAQPLELPEESGRWLFERGLVWLMLLGLVALACYVLLASLGLVDTKVITPWGETVAKTLGFVGRDAGLNRVMVGAGAFLVGMVLVALLLQRWFVQSGGEDRASHVLSADENGMVVINSSGIANVAAASVQHIPGVVNVKVRVEGKGAAPVQLEMMVWASAAVEQNKVGDEVRQKATDAVERLVGLQVHNVVVHMKAVPLEDLGRMLE